MPTARGRHRQRHAVPPLVLGGCAVLLGLLAIVGLALATNLAGGGSTPTPTRARLATEPLGTAEPEGSTGEAVAATPAGRRSARASAAPTGQAAEPEPVSTPRVAAAPGPLPELTPEPSEAPAARATKTPKPLPSNASDAPGHTRKPR